MLPKNITQNEYITVVILFIPENSTSKQKVKMVENAMRNQK